MSDVWEWLKENWRTVIFGVFTLGIGLVVGRWRKKAPVVLNPELGEHYADRRRIEQEAERQIADAKRRRNDEVTVILFDHDQTLKKLNHDQNQRVKELLDDPEALSDYLVKVGREVREP